MGIPLTDIHASGPAILMISNELHWCLLNLSNGTSNSIILIYMGKNVLQQK